MDKQIVQIIAGPTASGKSARALERARTRPSVIINADSMQLYAGLPLLTAQPGPADMEEIPHRLYGCLDANDHANAMGWRERALAEIYAALDAGQVPLVVGGSGFYLKALIEGLSPIPEIPEEIRVLSDDLMDHIGVDAFYKKLIELDPGLEGRIDPHNRQRLVRAYEVSYYTGKPMSYWQSLPPVGVPEDLAFEIELILPERDDLYARCDGRFDEMVANGVMDEVTSFDDAINAGKVSPDSPLTRALGFVPLQSFLNGESDLDTAIMLSKNDTRHYAKRQLTWFRHQLTGRHGASVADKT